MSKRYNQLTMPIEIVHGEKDWLLTVDRHVTGFAERLPDARSERCPRCRAHGPPCAARSGRGGHRQDQRPLCLKFASPGEAVPGLSLPGRYWSGTEPFREYSAHARHRIGPSRYSHPA